MPIFSLLKHPVMRYIALSFITLLFCVSSCSKRGTTPAAPARTFLNLPNDVGGPLVQIDSLPLRAGAQWNYQVLHQSSTSLHPGNIDTSYDGMTIASDTTVAGNVYAFTYRSLLSQYITTDSFFLSNQHGALYQLTSLLNTDSTYIIDSGFCLLKLSPALSPSWPSNETGVPGYSHAMVTREVMGYVTVTTAAGTFNCLKIEASDPGRFAVTDQYYCSKGLVQQITILTEETGAPGEGYYYDITTYRLLSTNL